jgi:hypothetical protein
MSIQVNAWSVLASCRNANNLQGPTMQIWAASWHASGNHAVNYESKEGHGASLIMHCIELRLQESARPIFRRQPFAVD